MTFKLDIFELLAKYQTLQAYIGRAYKLRSKSGNGSQTSGIVQQIKFLATQGKISKYPSNLMSLTNPRIILGAKVEIVARLSQFPEIHTKKVLVKNVFDSEDLCD